MTRLASAVRLEVTLQVRQRFLHAAVFSGLIWLAVLLPMPQRLRPVAEPYILLGDLAIIGFFFVGGIVFFEKQERTLGAVICTPLRFWEYLVAKLAVLLGITLFVSVVVVTAGHGFAYHLDWPAPGWWTAYRVSESDSREGEHVVGQRLARRRRKCTQHLDQPLALGGRHLAQHPLDGDAPMPGHPVNDSASLLGDGQGDVPAIIC